MRSGDAFSMGGTRYSNRPPQGGRQVFSFEDLEGGFGNFSDLFSSLFDLGRRSSSGTQKRRRESGKNLEYVLKIPFLTAVHGGKVSFDVSFTEDCVTCGGSGAKPGTESQRCPECGGTGDISFGQGGFAVKRPCPACFSRGIISGVPCGSCAGQGALGQKRKLQVRVPPGVDTGAKVQLSGQGAKGHSGGKHGNLIITFKVEPHRFFKRQGLDIHVAVPINIEQATLGTKIKVQTVSGQKVILKIPEGTQSGTKFRIRDQGIEKDGVLGDQFVEVLVQVPEELTEEEQQAMEEFATARGMRD
ncbi:MAG TPA: molecular chaperone DnaJ [Gemmatimonadetes bacterium]|nr:molecular chaperone DnaJ [Gemmatimonadota bacterium]